MIYKDIAEEIERLRCKLHFEIERSGIESEKTIEVSEELDNLISDYYIKKKINFKDSCMYSEYKIAYDQIKQIVIKTKQFPTVKEWNELAKENTYLNNKSIEYMSRT